jgi:hypothetical protein
MPRSARLSLISTVVFFVVFVRSFWWADFLGRRTLPNVHGTAVSWDATYQRVGLCRGLVIWGTDTFTGGHACFGRDGSLFSFPEFESEHAGPSSLFWINLAPSWDDTVLGFSRHMTPHTYSETWQTHGYWQPAMAIPLWPLIIVSALPWLRWLHQRNRRLARGHCLRCGYDLLCCRERCSECGESIPLLTAAEFLAQW